MTTAERKDYAKREIYVDGKYAATTTWARTNKAARKRFCEMHDLPHYRVVVRMVRNG